MKGQFFGAPDSVGLDGYFTSVLKKPERPSFWANFDLNIFYLFHTVTGKGTGQSRDAML